MLKVYKYQLPIIKHIIYFFHKFRLATNGHERKEIHSDPKTWNYS